MLTPTYDQTKFKDQSLLLDPKQTLQGAAEEDPLDKIQIICIESETDSYHVANNQNQRGENQTDSAPMTNIVPEHRRTNNKLKLSNEKPCKWCFCEKQFSQSGDLTKQENSYGREAVCLQHLCENIHLWREYEEAHEDSHRCQASHLQLLHQIILFVQKPESSYENPHW